MRWKDGILIAISSGIVGFLLRGYFSLGSLELQLINGILVVLGFLVVLIAGSDILAIIRDYLKERKEKREENRDKEIIFNWLYTKTKGYQGYSLWPSPNDPRWISTRDIARHNHLKIDRVHDLCITHKGIVLMGKEDLHRNELFSEEEKWAIKEFVR